MTNIKPMVMVTVDEQKDRMSHPSNPVVTAMARNRPGLWLSRIWAWHRWHFMASGVVYRPNDQALATASERLRKHDSDVQAVASSALFVPVGGGCVFIVGWSVMIYEGADVSRTT